MSRLLSLAAGTIPEYGPVDAVEAAAAAGFPAVGIWFDVATWTERVAADVRSRLDDTGLVALDVEPVMLSPQGDHGEELIDAAISIGARHVLVASIDRDHTRVATRLGQLADRLHGAPLRLVLEFLPSLGVRTLGEAMSIIERVARPEVGILVDNLHLARSGGTVDELANLGTHLFPYVQMCDASGQPVDGSRAGLLDEALHHRRLPGAGELALDAFLLSVPQVPVSFEIRSAALRAEYPDASERACAVWAAVRHFAGC